MSYKKRKQKSMQMGNCFKYFVKKETKEKVTDFCIKA